MDLFEAMRTNGTCRDFRPDPVPEDVLYRAFEAARFGPQGGNRQPLSWVVVRDQELKESLRELYLGPWRAYIRDRVGVDIDDPDAPAFVRNATRMAYAMADIPAIAVLCADLSRVEVVDRDLDRTSVVGGASIYPTMQNLALALRAQGVATAVTTLLVGVEDQVKDVLRIPEHLATVAHVMVGYPLKAFPTTLRRRPVEEFVFADRHGERMFAPAEVD
ncbi:MAG: nitroreductase family protein [Cumulibacter sp.]